MRKLLASVLLLVMCTLVMGFFLARKNVVSNKIQFNAKDLPDDGLTLVGPTDASYDKELVKALKKKDGLTKELVEPIRPFSVILVNKSKRDVIAYAIKWEAVDANGAVLSRIDSYIQPGTLMGETPSTDEKISEMGPAIKTNRAKLLFWGGEDTDLSPLRSKEEIINPQLGSAVSVTASLEAAVLDDGTVIGPNSTNLFSQIEDQVQAKKDLLRSIHDQYFSGVPPKEILDAVGTIAAQPEERASDDSPGSYYRYYRRLYAGEIAATRNRDNDDKKAIMRALMPLRNKWNKLSKKQKNSAEQPPTP